MSEPSTVAIDSLSFLEVFSSSYREDRLDLIEVLSEALHMARSPHGLELLSYDLCFCGGCRHPRAVIVLLVSHRRPDGRPWSGCRLFG
jgi:hypothetical protein